MIVKNFTPFLVGALLLPMLAFGQDTGTANYGGTVPTTYRITGTDNASLADASTLQFGTLTVPTGSNTIITKSLSFRLRSNAAYVLSANATISGAGIEDGTAATTTGTTAQTLKTSDVAFGLSSTIDATGASVVGTRTDAIQTGYNITSSAPTVSSGRMSITGKSLHDIYGGTPVPILSGNRISASGDNSSSDNFIVVTASLATLPQYLTAGSFSGVITFTLGAS